MKADIIKLTKKQVLTIANIAREVYGLSKKYRYVAADYHGDIHAYVEKPSLITSFCWGASGESCSLLVYFSGYNNEQ